MPLQRLFLALVLFWYFGFDGGSPAASAEDKCATVLKAFNLPIKPKPKAAGASVAGSGNQWRARRIGSVPKSYSSTDPVVRKIRAVAIVPNLASEKAVFGSSDLTRSLQLDRVAHDLHGAGADVLRAEGGIGALVPKGGTSPDELVILMGHSEQIGGRQFIVFPDGSKKDFQELHTYARENDFHLLVLSCHSPDFALNRAVSFADGTRAVRKLLGNSITPEGMKKSDAVRQIKAEVIIGEKKLGLCFVVIAGVGAGLAIEAWEQEEEEEEKK